MHVLRMFLRPGWVLITLLVIGFAAACFLVLAPWQLGKNTDTEHRNDLIRAAADTPAVPMDQLAPGGAPFDKSVEWREVTVRGHYLDDGQALVRLRVIDERPAVEVVTPFQVAGDDQIVLVDRGYVRPGSDGSVSAPPAPDGEVTLSGRLRKSEGTSPGKEPRAEQGALTAYTIDAAQLSQAAGMRFDPFYLQLAGEQPGSLTEIGLPQLESGPYLSYGLQWLAFGIMAPLGVAYFVWSEVRHRRAVAAKAEGRDAVDPADRANERRRIRDELRSASAGDGDASLSEIGAGPQTESASDDVRAKLAQRYGR